MANNNENQVILANPNRALGKEGTPLDFRTSQPDDLTIYVELTTNKKSRGIINNSTQTYQTNTGRVGSINFISGSNFDGKNKSLTTSYTDISSAILQSNDNDLEGLGIESIDITFDTAYTPLIKIKFVDVRGGMFQQGNQSKYSVFFELPYPIFNLKVKGYYGRTVSYCLHLVKWNSLFNSTTGNFEIDAEFIGYTFAILADLLIGYMRAIPYVRGIGTNTFKEVKERYEELIGLDNIGGNQVITIDEMFQKISDFKTSIDQINQKSESYQKLVSVKKSTDILNKIKAANGDVKILLQKDANNILSASDLLFVKKGTTADLSTYSTNIDNLIREFEELLTEGLTDTQKKLLRGAIVSKTLKISDFIDETSGDFKPNPELTLINSIASQEIKYDVKEDRNKIKKVLDNIEVLYKDQNKKKSAENGFVIYDFIKFVETFNNIIDENSQVQNILIIKYQEELRNVLIQDFNFNPSVANIFRIILASAETFIRSVHRVSVNAENKDNLARRETLLKIIKQTDIPNDSTIFAFPLYVDQAIESNGKQQIEERWLGSNREIDKSVVDEIIFVEELLNQLVTLKQSDIDRSFDLNNSASWFGVNPLDSKIYLSKINPYYSLSINNANHPDDYARLLMYRTFTYLGLSNPYSLDGKSLEYMAKFEANNLFYGIPKSNYNEALTTIKSLLYQDHLSSSDNLINHWIKGSSNIKNYYGLLEAKPYMSLENGDYKYRYINQYLPILSANTSYIPISGDYSGKSFYREGEFQLKPQSELLDIANNIDYLGNYINSDKLKNNDGAKYLDVISLETYQSIPNTLPTNRAVETIGSDDTSGYNKDFKDSGIKANTITGTDEIKQFDPLKYRFYSNEFFTIIPEGNPDRSDVSTVFIQDTKVGTRFSTKGGNEGNVILYKELIDGNQDIIVPDISFVSVNTTGTKAIDEAGIISLFGSPLYYAQNANVDPFIRNYAKSYLFLNTLPLTGLYGKGDLFDDGTLVNGIFTKNAGFIKVPTIWAAWVGSLLWRINEAERLGGGDPIITKTWYNQQPISIVKTSDNENFNKTQHIMPSPYELFYNLENVISGKEEPMYFKFTQIEYKEISKVLLGLPEQAKEVLIDFFKAWSDNQFTAIKNQYELLNDNFVNISIYNGGAEMQPWADRLNFIAGTPTGLIITEVFSQSPSLTKPGITENLFKDQNNPDGRNSVTIIRDSPDGQNANPYSVATYFLPYFKIKLSDDSNTLGNQTLRQSLGELSVIVNYTPRTFTYDANPTSIKTDISINSDRLSEYLGFLTDEYKRLYDAEQQEGVDTSARDAIFGSANLNLIKLDVYRHLKSIHDKWIYSDNENNLISPCGDDDKVTLFDRFLFIDKNWEDIGDDFILNPSIIEEILRSKYNQTLYDVISRVLGGNNFNFIPLPNYVEYKTPAEMEKNIFTPYPYVDMVKSTTSVGPKFICMYVGQTSNHLDLKDSQYPDDGLDLNNSIDGLTKKGNPIPAFEVNYGSQNQNFFKDIKLDQREFTETQESLEIIDSISDSEDKNKATFASQNLFNVYQIRAYNAEISALGMPLIQPMMYFQLNNIPMFRGAYVIISTSHSIKPNHMTTSFKGVRVKKENTPINRQVILLKDLNIAETDLKGQKYDIRDIITNGVDSFGRTGYAGSPIIDVAATGDYYIDGFNQRSAITTENVLNFDRPSNTKKNGSNMTYNEIFAEISVRIGFNMDAIKVMSIMESQGGTFKGNREGINSSGFVGLMQFGHDATVDVTGDINNYLKNLPDYPQYEFSAVVNSDKTIKYPPTIGKNWSKAEDINKPSTNSMFDDYISTLAGVYYARKNFKYLKNSPNDINVTEVYLAHQQGKGGFDTIVDNPSSNISSNMENNYPPPYNKASTNRPKQNQQWYSGWAGNVDAASYKVNPNFVSKFNTGLFVKAKGGSTPVGASDSPV